MKTLFISILTMILLIPAVLAQSDEEMLKKIYDKALKEGKSYEMLEFLSTEIGHRLSGSPQAAAAVEWTRQVMESYGFDTVFLQPVMVPHWVRGNVETGKIVKSKIGTKGVNICALGNSIGTGVGGIRAGVIEVKNFDELESLGSKNIEGKIVFFNRPMDPTLIRTFSAYGGAVNQRGQGASKAAKFGAVGVVVRSMTLSSDDVPHTGAMNYAPDVPKIPAVAISTNDADLLSALLNEDKDLEFFFETHSEMLPDVLSYNVIGEIHGKKNPDQYLVMGGHLDSWDMGDGSHDDGAGCMQSIEALRIFKELGIKPNHSIRAVMFMNEENGLRGGREYARVATKRNEKHVAAIESDRGGFVPRGFTMSATDENFEKISSWAGLFKPYQADNFLRGGGGADIGPLRAQNTTLIGLYPDSQRYFDYHHTAIDTFDKVNKRELELGAAAMASMIYLIDKYGIE
jgi:hypothetical protein